MELEKVVVSDGSAAVGLVELGGQVPGGEAHARGDEHVHHPGLGGLGDREPAVGAAKGVGARVGRLAHEHLHVGARQLDVATGGAASSNRRHGSPFRLPQQSANRGRQLSPASLFWEGRFADFRAFGPRSR